MNSEITPIPDIKKLTKTIENNGLMSQMLEFSSDECTIQFAESNLQTIIDFAITFERRILFYQYLYLNKEDFVFENIETDRRGQPHFPSVQKYLIAHNKKMEKIDFSIPLALNVFCLYEGHSIGIMMTDPQMAELMMYSKENIQDDLQDLANEAYREMESESRESQKILHDKLFEMILNDAEFGKMKNEPLRMKYLDDLLETPENAKYADIFGHSFNKYGKKQFLSLVWSEYKELHKNG